MRTTRLFSQLLIAVVLCGGAGAWVPAAWAQGPRIVRPGLGPKIGQNRRPPLGGPHAIEKFNSKTPEERERLLNRLPDERRKAVEQRVEKYNKLSERQKEKLNQQFQDFDSLSPEKKRAARLVYRDFNQLEPERKRAIRSELVRLRDLTPEERRTRLDGDELKDKLNADERRILEDMASVFPEE